MTTTLTDLIALAQSLSGRDQPEVMVRKALDSALAALGERAGLALMRSSLSPFRVASHQGMGGEGESVARVLCEPGNPVLLAIEGCRCQLLTADDDRLVRAVRRSTADEDVRFLAVVPFLAVGESFGGMVLFLRQEPDKLLWAEGLPYIGATAGLALGQGQLRETIAKQGRLASLGRVAAGVAHDLRNPLTILGATLELLRYDPQLGGEVRGKLDGAQDAFQRVAQLIDGLSGYSKPTRSAGDPVPVSELFSTLLNLLGPEARDRQIEIAVWTTPPSLAVRGNRGQLLEVLINVVENAMDAIERDGQVTLRASLVGDQVQISVRDSGPGILPELLDRIFEPFFTTKANGTGLGLAIVREIVEQSGGAIRVESEIGGGAEFCAMFPAG
ncbi:MAG: GHKL domain-containing protein [Candidatus Rokubacteria bacterium]|nr:GHKL domain-containing protein [Candidatus Rokubacteria bacterium]